MTSSATGAREGLRAMARRPKGGDVSELRTPCGFGYVQYTHDHPEDGDLVRVLPGVYPVRPDPIDSLVAGHRFFVFYPVSSALPHAAGGHGGPSRMRLFRKPEEVDLTAEPLRGRSSG